MGWDGIVSTASIDAFLKCRAPLPPQLTLQGVAGSPALDSGLRDTYDPVHTHTHTHTSCGKTSGDQTRGTTSVKTKASKGRALVTETISSGH